VRQPAGNLALLGFAEPLTDEGQHRVFFTFRTIVVRDAQSVNSEQTMHRHTGPPMHRPERAQQSSGAYTGRHQASSSAAPDRSSAH
jgi:hypothetical protein